MGMLVLMTSHVQQFFWRQTVGTSCPNRNFEITHEPGLNKSLNIGSNTKFDTEKRSLAM